MAITLTSCGGTPTVSESGTSLFANRKMTSTSISYSCEKDNRNATYTFQVKKNHADEIAFNATVEYGFFTYTLSDSSGVTLKADIVVDDVNYTIPLNGSGKYKLNIITDDFKGTYQFKWSK